MYNIPDINYYTLKRLFQFLFMIVSNREVTKMTAENISTILEPTLHLPNLLINKMIYHFEEIFYEEEFSEQEE